MKGAKELLKRFTVVSDHLKRKRIIKWTNDGRPFPPPHDIKQLAILYYGVTYELDTLIETGTYLGDMIWAQKDFFRQIFSIELSEDLYTRARKRFASFPHIKLLQGDSSEKIGEIVHQLNAPALFWLDGHYSGGITAKGEKICPIFEELTHIFSSSQPHVVIIDDARLFVGKDDYPTIRELAAFVEENSGYSFRTENDFILLTPSENSKHK